MKKRSLALISIIIITLSIFTACGNSPNLVGVWYDNDSSTVWELRSDGVGVLVRTGDIGEFLRSTIIIDGILITWHTSGNMLIITEGHHEIVCDTFTITSNNFLTLTRQGFLNTYLTRID